MSPGFAAVVIVASYVAGAIAAVTGFGIGSILTPVFALSVDAGAAVALVSIPHVVGTAQRFWLLRHHVDRRVLLAFGLTSAAGGLIGALLHSAASNRELAFVFSALLIMTAVSELSGWMARVQWPNWAGWIAGLLSGLFGGLVGNQGSIRSAAMLAFNIPRVAFVATATAIALFVDGGRVPVYLVTDGASLLAGWKLLLVSVIGVVAGTLTGARVLSTISERAFRRALAVFIGLLGIYMIVTNV